MDNGNFCVVYFLFETWSLNISFQISAIYNMNDIILSMVDQQHISLLSYSEVITVTLDQELIMF